jgi:hypothetical protein
MGDGDVKDQGSRIRHDGYSVMSTLLGDTLLVDHTCGSCGQFEVIGVGCHPYCVDKRQKIEERPYLHSRRVRFDPGSLPPSCVGLH